MPRYTHVEQEAHELVTFQGFVVHLMRLANTFSVSMAVEGRQDYCTIYWFYVSSTFCTGTVLRLSLPKSGRLLSVCSD